VLLTITTTRHPAADLGELLIREHRAIFAGGAWGWYGGISDADGSENVAKRRAMDDETINWGRAAVIFGVHQPVQR
jgi:hypothetical protein